MGAVSKCGGAVSNCLAFYSVTVVLWYFVESNIILWVLYYALHSF